MANYQNILRQAHQAIADVADNADSWRAFLRSAAYTTHYAFPNQALIYSQRPGATMLADIDTWNRAAGRWVNRGARGVASLGTGNMAGNVRYLFDIKDTHPAGKAAKPLGWQITDANRYPTLQALQEKHNAESLPEIFGLQAALFVAQHGKQLDADLQNAVIGSTLEWAKPQEQTAIFANLITQSAVYMAAVRCGLGDSAVPQDAFADIDRFDTESAVLALGNAVNRAGRQMFAEIGAVVKSIDSVAKTQPKQYDENVSKTNQQEVQDHGYDESERVSGAQDGNEGNAQTAGRENRSAAGEVPAREPLPAVRQDAAGRDAVQRPETDRAALLGAGGADHHEAAGQQPGTGQEQRPIGLDGAHEQSASAGSGIGDAHRDEPVNTEPTTAESELSPSAVSVSDEIELPESVGRGNLAEETAAAIGLPAPEQQQETIRQLQHRASWQPPIKDDGTHIDEQDIVDVLVMGSGFCEGRFRIQEFFSATVYNNFRAHIDVLYGKINTPMKIDITTGDKITPAAVQYEFPCFDSEKKIPIMAYTIETILAEKYETIIRRGATTTRARDFYDLYTLYRTRKSEIRPQVLKDAVLHTAEKRESLEDLADWKEILDDLRDDSSMQQLWDSYGMSNSYAAAITFGQTLETVKEISELIESL